MDDQLKIIISTEIDTSKSEKQINAQLKQVKPETVKIAVEFDTKNMKELKKQLADIAKEQEKLQGFSSSKVSIKTTNTGEIDSASIKYYNDLTKETVTQLYTIDKETGNLALKTKELTSDYQAQAKAEQAINKQRLDFINNQTISLDKLKSSYADNNALKSLDGDNLTQLNSVYDGIIAKTEQLKTADKTRSEQLQREIKAEIASYEQLIKSKQNSQYVATSLRTKDVSTINAEEVNNLRKFEAQIKNSSVNTNAMETDLKDLHTTLSTAFDADSLTTYFNKLDVVKSKFSALKEEAKIKITDDSSNLQNQTKYYDKIKQELITIQKLKKQLANAGTEESVEINKQINNAQKRISYDEQQIEKKKLYNQESFKEVNELKLIQEAENKIASAKQNDKVNDSYIKKQIQEEQQLQSQKDQFNAKNLNAIDLEIQKQEQASKAFSNQLKSQMQSNVDYTRQAESLEQINVKANIGKNRLIAFSKELKSTARQEYATTINNIANSFDNVSKSADPSKALKQAELSLRDFQSSMKSMGNVGNTFLTKLGKNLYNFFGFLGSATIAMSAINGIRSMVSSITELDTQMVELRKVTNETESTYQKFYYTANETAKNLGTSTANVISATASWAQMGYSIQQATELAKSSEILSNISENMNVDEATSTLVSSIKAFGLDANKVLDGVVSKINEVGNQFAVTNSDVADILQRSSSAMSDANNTMEETIALGTAATEITRNAEETGTALKTLSMRIRGMNEDTGETDDSLKNLSKTVKGLTGVSIFTDETNQTYKSTYQILQQISKVYGNLSDKSQAQVLELIAGKRQGQVVSSMLSNFSTAEKALEVQANSAGGAMREQATYMSSINAHVNTLKETFVGLGQSLIKSNLVKTIVDIGTAGVSGFKGLIDTLHTIPTLAGVASLALSSMGKQQIFGNQNGSFSFLGKTIEEMKQAKDEGQKFGGLFTKQVLQPFANAESVINKYNLGLKNNSLTQKGFQRLLDQSDKTLSSYLTGLQGAPANVSEYTTSLNTSKASTIGLTVATTAMNMAMTMGIAALVTLAITGISKLITYQQDCIDKANELTSAYKDSQKTISDNTSTIQGLKSEFETLSKGVGEYGNNIALSTEEYKRYQDIVSQILGITPQLTSGYDAEGNAITKKNDLIERSIALLKEEQKQKLADITTDDKLIEIGKGKKEETKKAKDKTQSTGKEAMDMGLELVQEVSADSASKNSGAYSQLMQNYNTIFTSKDLDEKNQALENFKNNLKNLNVDGGKNLVDFIDKVKSYDSANMQAEKTSKGFATSLQNVAQATDNYDTLTDAQKNFTTTYIDQFKLTGAERDKDFTDMGDKVRTFVDTLANASDESKANINNLFTLDKSKMSAGEYQKQADTLIDIIAKEFKMNPVDLKVQLGMDSVDNLINEAKKKVNATEVNSAYTSNEASNKSSFIEGLSEEDLKILIKMGDVGSMSIDDLREAINNAKKSTNALSDSSLKTTEELSKEYEKATKAVTDFSSSASSIASIMQTISSGQKVDATTLLDLISKYPQYASEIVKVNNSKEDGIAVAKLLFEANKTQALAELENDKQVLISQRNILAMKKQIAGQPLEAIDGYNDITNHINSDNDAENVIKGSSFEDFQKKDTGKKSDPNQDAYEKAMANHIHLHNMQLESDTDFYNAMEQANETYYKNDIDHLKDYNTNIETIYNGRNDIIKQAFEDEKEIASNGNSGSIADQKKYLETLSKLNDEYYKGKTQFGKEYIATQKEIAKGQADLIKQENESQIDYVNSMKDKFDKAADDKINALKAQNDLADKQLEKQQHLLDLEEKEIALKHAQEKTRMIVSDSGIEYDTNLDDIKNAEQDVAKAKQAIEQDKVDEQVTALEEAKKTGDNIYDVLLEMYKVLAGKDIIPTKSDPEVEARLKQATTIDKDGTTLVNGTPITPLSETNPLFGGIPLLPNFNQGNFNMDNILGNPLSKLGDLGAVTNNSKTSSYVYSFDGANFNLPSVKNPADFLKQLPSLLDNSTAQINGKTN